jgi:hypothetical protein
MRVRATVHCSPNGLGVVLRILRRRPHGKLAAVAVIPRAQQTAPGMTMPFSPAPSERFGISNRRFDLLVRMPRPAQIASILHKVYVNKCQHPEPMIPKRIALARPFRMDRPQDGQAKQSEDSATGGYSIDVTLLTTKAHRAQVSLDSLNANKNEPGTKQDDKGRGKQQCDSIRDGYQMRWNMHPARDPRDRNIEGQKDFNATEHDRCSPSYDRKRRHHMIEQDGDTKTTSHRRTSILIGPSARPWMNWST